MFDFKFLFKLQERFLAYVSVVSEDPVSVRNEGAMLKASLLFLDVS